MSTLRLLFFTACIFLSLNARADGEALLYSTQRSSCALRTRILLHYKKIPFHISEKDEDESSQTAYEKLNPQEKIPLLILDGHALSQTMAIAEYLEETRHDFPLLPKDPLLRTKVRQICMIIAADIQPLQNLAVLAHLPKKQRHPWAQHWIRKGLQALEKIIGNHTGPYTMGENFTLADAFLYPQLRNASIFDIDMTPYPNLRRIHEHLQQHPAVVQALNDVHKTELPQEKTRNYRISAKRSNRQISTRRKTGRILATKSAAHHQSKKYP